METFEVIIVGAGPVGLVSALQLGRAGVKALVLERRPTFSVHPKAAGIHARTMEIYRQLGVSDSFRANGINYNGGFGACWVTRLNGIEIGSMKAGGAPEQARVLRSWSPESQIFCTQDIYEPMLAEVLKKYPSVELRLGSEAIALQQDDKGVTVKYSTANGEKEARALYLIGADGMRSPIRNFLGIRESGVATFGHSINVVFNADLEAYRGGREYGLFYAVNPDVQGAFLWRKRGNQWSFNFEAHPGVDLASYTNERCAEIVRAAVGVPNLEVDVGSVLHWKLEQAVTEKWRSGRVFLAGDSAHHFPPVGGFGMNSGVQDSFNLVWKLLAGLYWGAGDKLLDSYEDERKPVAEFNGAQSVQNARHVKVVDWIGGDLSAFDKIEKPEGETLRLQIRDAIPKQQAQLFSHGQQFGPIYHSTALVDDGTPIEESTVAMYVPSGHPGARAPHVWLADGRSSIDLYNGGGGFTLLAASNGAHWLDAAASVARVIKAPLAAFQINGPDIKQPSADKQWEDVVGVGPTGALLVRPDGYVGARWQTLPNEAAAALKSAMESILA